MPKKMIRRALRLLSIHARNGEDIIDYREFFEGLASEKRRDRYVCNIKGTMTAYSRVQHLDNGLIAFLFASGDADDTLSFFDLEEKIQKSVDQTNGFYSTPVWVIVNPVERFIVKELRRPGVSDRALETYFEHYSRDRLGYAYPRFSLNPVPDRHFIETLNRLEVIKKVDVTLNRPNYDWGDSESRITAIAEESGASTATLSMTAGAKQSLKKNKGIVRDVVKIIRSGLRGPIKNIIIKGSRTADAPEQTLNEKNYQRQAVTSFPSEASREEQFARLSSAGTQLIGDAVTDMREGNKKSPVK